MDLYRNCVDLCRTCVDLYSTFVDLCKTCVDQRFVQDLCRSVDRAVCGCRDFHRYVPDFCRSEQDFVDLRTTFCRSRQDFVDLLTEQCVGVGRQGVLGAFAVWLVAVCFTVCEMWAMWSGCVTIVFCVGHLGHHSCLS